MTPPTVRMPERVLQNQIVQYARLRGWCVWHQLWSRGTRAGWPDLFLLRPPKALAIECKRQDGKVRREQAECLELLRQCGIEALVVRPSDWDEIVEALA